MAVHDTLEDMDPNTQLTPYMPVPPEWEGFFDLDARSGLMPGVGEPIPENISPKDAAIELRNSIRKQLNAFHCKFSTDSMICLQNIIYGKYGDPRTNRWISPRKWLTHTTLDVAVALHDIQSGNKISRFPDLVTTLRCFIQESAWRSYGIKYPELPLEKVVKVFAKFGGAENPTTMIERRIFTAQVFPGHKLTAITKAMAGCDYAMMLERDGVEIFNKIPPSTNQETEKEDSMKNENTDDGFITLEEPLNQSINQPKTETATAKEETVNTQDSTTRLNESARKMADAANAVKSTAKKRIDYKKLGVNTLKVGGVALLGFAAFKTYKHFKGAGVIGAAADATPAIVEGVAESGEAIAQAAQAVYGLFKG